jgi:uncharacterized protein
MRELSQRMGLHTHDKPSAACLASRIPYGEPITEEKLGRIERAEQALHRLGFRSVRVRTHGRVARIELGDDEAVGRMMDPEMRGDVADAVRKAGYDYVALDLEGYRTGSMNETLTENERTEATTS